MPDSPARGRAYSRWRVTVCATPRDTVRGPSTSPSSDERNPRMKVWIDQDLCTGDGLCEEIAPDVFTLLDDGLAYVKEGSKIYATAQGNPQGADGLAVVPAGQEEAV